MLPWSMCSQRHFLASPTIPGYHRLLGGYISSAQRMRHPYGQAISDDVGYQPCPGTPHKPQLPHLKESWAQFFSITKLPMVSLLLNVAPCIPGLRLAFASLFLYPYRAALSAIMIDAGQ